MWRAKLPEKSFVEQLEQNFWHFPEQDCADDQAVEVSNPKTAAGQRGAGKGM
jgi:hypothetical protein